MDTPLAVDHLSHSPALQRSDFKIRTLLRSMRPYQWPKNLLLFVPLITAHEIFAPRILGQFAYAFIAFCLTASAGYVLNDILDLEYDRYHEIKKWRPLARGELSIVGGLSLSLFCVVAGGVVSTFLPTSFRVVLLLYFLSSVFYSTIIKRLAFFDVVALAMLFSARILGGVCAGGLVPSRWLLVFSFFFFASMALVKRYAEILRCQGFSITASRGYFAGDKSFVGMLGVLCGAGAMLIFLLYIVSPEASFLYRNPSALLLTAPGLVFWLARTWRITFRGEMNADPVLFAVTDRMSYLAGFYVALTLWYAAKGL